jgi:hypothetical protein
MELFDSKPVSGRILGKKYQLLVKLKNLLLTEFSRGFRKLKAMQ